MSGVTSQPPPAENVCALFKTWHATLRTWRLHAARSSRGLGHSVTAAAGPLTSPCAAARLGAANSRTTDAMYKDSRQDYYGNEVRCAAGTRGWAAMQAHAQLTRGGCASGCRWEQTCGAAGLAARLPSVRLACCLALASSHCANLHGFHPTSDLLLPALHAGVTGLQCRVHGRTGCAADAAGAQSTSPRTPHRPALPSAAGGAVIQGAMLAGSRRLCPLAQCCPCWWGAPPCKRDACPIRLR